MLSPQLQQLKFQSILHHTTIQEATTTHHTDIILHTLRDHTTQHTSEHSPDDL